MPSLVETVGTVLDTLLPGVVEEEQPPRWPPDVFCLCAAVLQRSGAYAVVVDDHPPHLRRTTSGKRTALLEDVAKRWRAAAVSGQPIPTEVKGWWRTLIKHANRRITNVVKSAECCAALINLLAVADETCVGVGIAISKVLTRTDWSGEERDTFLEAAEERLLLSAQTASTSCMHIHPSKARVLPKMHTAQNGLTIRSLSHYICSIPSSDVSAEWLSWSADTQHHALNLLIVPWPQRIQPSQFRESRKVKLTDEVQRGGYGLFTFSAASGPKLQHVKKLIAEAEKNVGHVDGVVFPELAMSPDEYTRLAKALVTEKRFLIAGVGSVATGPNNCGDNRVRMDVSLPGGAIKASLDQKKHHRWKLTKSQIMQYGIGATLHPEANWWEHISLKDRSLAFVTLRPWLTLSVLVCEDLARPDPVGDLIRAVGPNLVVALLMDGPQLTARWPGRYAGSLADDPGCSVLTITSAGMSGLSQPSAGSVNRSRTVVLWRDAKTGVQEIDLPQNASAILLNLSVQYDEEWTADGRGDGGVSGYPILAGHHPI